MMLDRLRLTSLASVTLVLFTGGCVDSFDPGVPLAIEETSFASALGVDLGASTKTANGAYYRDIVAGAGPLVTSGQSIDVRYTGWLSSGLQFDTNLNDPSPFTFVLGRGDVIAGWDDTIPGMRVGGKRQLIIPSHLAYGPFGSGPIPGHAVIVFNVEIVAAR